MASSKKKPKKKKTRKPAPAKKPARVSASSSSRKSKAKKPAKREPKRAPKRAPKKQAKRPKLTPRQKSARKAARTRKRNRLERESIELGERERLADDAEAKARRAAGDERQLLIDVLEEMRDVGAGVTPLSLDITEAEVGARIPWLVVGRFDCVGLPSYAELGEVFEVWRDDLVLEAKIHPQRLSQIRIVYSDPNAKRGESDSIIAHMGPWESVISETAHEIGTGDPGDPAQEDSLSMRYRETKVPTFYVYFSGRLSSEVEFSL